MVTSKTSFGCQMKLEVLSLREAYRLPSMTEKPTRIHIKRDNIRYVTIPFRKTKGESTTSGVTGCLWTTMTTKQGKRERAVQLRSSSFKLLKPELTAGASYTFFSGPKRNGGQTTEPSSPVQKLNNLQPRICCCGQGA